MRKNREARQERENRAPRFVLFGFRSRTPGKKMIAALYYVAALAILILGLCTPPFVPAGPWDTFVYRLTIVFFYFWMMTPAIFLSESPMRRVLPFLRDKQRLRSFLGMALVFLGCVFLFAVIDSMHTAAYRAEIERYYLDFYSATLPGGI